MEENNSPQADARGAAQAADLLVTVAATLNERRHSRRRSRAQPDAFARGSGELMTAFRGA
jgi:hypothetical protein